MANKKEKNGDPIDEQLNRYKKQGHIPFIVHAAKTPELNYDGIAYLSRHLGAGSYSA